MRVIVHYIMKSTRPWSRVRRIIREGLAKQLLSLFGSSPPPSYWPRTSEGFVTPWLTSHVDVHYSANLSRWRSLISCSLACTDSVMNRSRLCCKYSRLCSTFWVTYSLPLLRLLCLAIASFEVSGFQVVRGFMCLVLRYRKKLQLEGHLLLWAGAGEARCLAMTFLLSSGVATTSIKVTRERNSTNQEAFSLCENNSGWNAFKFR